METHKVVTLSLSWTLSASFEGGLNFEILSFWFSCSPWDLEWMFLLYLFHLIHSFLLAYCSVLSVHGLSVSWLQRYFVMLSAYVFITNIVAKTFCPDKQTDWFTGPCLWKAVIDFIIRLYAKTEFWELTSSRIDYL